MDSSATVLLIITNNNVVTGSGQASAGRVPCGDRLTFVDFDPTGCNIVFHVCFATMAWPSWLKWKQSGAKKLKSTVPFGCKILIIAEKTYQYTFLGGCVTSCKIGWTTNAKSSLRSKMPLFCIAYCACMYATHAALMLAFVNPWSASHLHSPSLQKRIR
jgi:hypothetical protein